MSEELQKPGEEPPRRDLVTSDLGQIKARDLTQEGLREILPAITRAMKDPRALDLAAAWNPAVIDLPHLASACGIPLGECAALLERLICAHALYEDGSRHPLVDNQLLKEGKAWQRIGS